MNAQQAPACPPDGGGPAPSPGAPREWQSGGATHLDVRGLAPPQPLVAILRLVRSAAPGASVVAHLDRDPMLLYPELAELGWEALPLDGDPGEVRLLLRRVE